MYVSFHASNSVHKQRQHTKHFPDFNAVQKCYQINEPSVHNIYFLFFLSSRSYHGQILSSPKPDRTLVSFLFKHSNFSNSSLGCLHKPYELFLSTIKSFFDRLPTIKSYPFYSNIYVCVCVCIEPF